MAACRQRECGGLDAKVRRECVRACRERSTCTAPGVTIRTLAYVVTECRQDPQDLTVSRQRLLVRRGNCDPITVLETPQVGPAPDPFFYCRFLGDSGIGWASVTFGLFQRFGVLPDGSGVVFELTDDFSMYPPLTPKPTEEGIFFVRADGTGLRRLGPNSGVPALSDPPELPFAMSPDSRTLAYTDLGPGPDGRDAAQIVTLDVATGRRRQLTHFQDVPGNE